MAGQPKIEVQISAKADQLAAGLAKAKRDIAGLPALAEQASRRTGAIDFFGGRVRASMSGMDRVESQIGRIQGLAKMGLSGLGRAGGMVPGLGLVAGAASVAGLGQMVGSVASMGVELKNTAYLSGTSAAGLNSMRGAARMLGLSAGTADEAMTGLNHAIQDAAFGKDASALNLFQLAGIDIGSIARGAKSSESALLPVVDAMTRAAKVNPLAAEAMAQTWRIPSGALPLFVRGTVALQANRQEIEKAYGSMGAYLKASEDYVGASARMGMASDRLGMTITTALSPPLSKLLNQFADWTDGHQKDVKDAFDGIGKAINDFNWKAAGDGADYYIRKLAAVANQADDLATRVNRAGHAVGSIIDAVTYPGRTFANWAAPQRNQLVADADGRVMTADDPRALEINNRRRAYDYATSSERVRGGMPPGATTHYGPGAPPLPSAEQELRASQGRDILTSLGWSPTQAAGIMANLHRESKFNEGAVGDSGAAYGIAQWHSDRLAKIHAGMGRDVVGMSFEDQVRAVDYELRHNEKGAGDALRQTKTAADAGDVVSRMYERPGATEAEASVRARSADAFDRRWSGGPSRSPQLTLPDASSAAPGGGTLQITIDHQNVPAGVTMTPKLQANGAELAGINVRKAMPHAGKMPPWGYVD